MKTKKFIAVNDFCFNHNIEFSFIHSLHETGLIEIATIEETDFFDAEQLREIESLIRFYYDLDINLEGIETITHLLHRINEMQNEITLLRNRLNLYE
jgi:chaperone modulatory protein CbpM